MCNKLLESALCLAVYPGHKGLSAIDCRNSSSFVLNVKTSMSVRFHFVLFDFWLSNDRHVGLAATDDDYKFRLYKLFNPDLKPLDLYKVHYKFPRLRLSAHRMPIETGRWRRLKREERTCTSCNTLGDEEHYIYTCPQIDRNELTDIPPLHELENYNKLSILMVRIEDYL